MKLFLAVILICSVMFNIIYADDISELLLENPNWLLNGLPAPNSATIEEIIEKYIPHSLPDYYSCDSLDRWQIDTVGKLNNHYVIDIFYNAKCIPEYDSLNIYEFKSVKAIAVETVPEKYRLIYMKNTEPFGIKFEPSRIVNQQILSTNSMVYGTGFFRDENYWIWNEKINMPIKLDISRAIQKAFSEVMPEGHGVWKGGRFDINSLSFKSYTWRDGDGNCCPSGGTIEIIFYIKNGKLLVKRASFDYSALEERAASHYHQCDDSTYPQQPEIVYDGEKDISVLNDPAMLFLNGYERIYESAPPATSASKLINDITRFIISGSIYQNWRTTPFYWQMDTILIINNNPIVEIGYSFICSNCRDTTGKVIAIEFEPDLLRPIYIEKSTYNKETLGQNSILTIDDDTILAVNGNATIYNTYTTDFWLFSTENRFPQSLYQRSVLETTVRQLPSNILPEDHHIVLHMGKWDFENLTYTTRTWQKNDLRDNPTGGQLIIKFDIRNRQLSPVGYIYTP